MNTRLARIAAAVAHEATTVQRDHAGCTCNPTIDVEMSDVGTVFSVRADHEPSCHVRLELAERLRCGRAWPTGDARLN